VARKKENKNKKWIVLFAALIAISIFIASAVYKIGSWQFFLPIEYIAFDINGHFQKWISRPVSWSSGLFKGIFEITQLKEENKRLREEIGRLQGEIVSYKNAGIENESYRRLLEIKKELPFPVVVANVVAGDLFPFSWVITVDKGKANGLGVDMSVLSGHGLVGRVIDASTNFSRVMLVTDKKSAVSVVSMKNRTHGILKGDGEGRLSLYYVERDRVIEREEEIITSGTDTIFPKGILVGKVVDVKLSSEDDRNNKSDIFQTITVDPVVDMKKLEEVIVQVRGRPLLDEKK